MYFLFLSKSLSYFTPKRLSMFPSYFLACDLTPSVNPSANEPNLIKPMPFSPSSPSSSSSKEPFLTNFLLMLKIYYIFKILIKINNNN